MLVLARLHHATQTPLKHLSPNGHARPQAPQLLGSDSVFISHPSDALPLQSANPGVQATNLHVPFTHAATPFGNEQKFPHRPQLKGSVLRFTHLPPQHVVPGPQHAVLPQGTLGGRHSQWHVLGSNTSGGLQAGTHCPEIEQRTVPLGQAQNPVKGSQKSLQHSEF